MKQILEIELRSDLCAGTGKHYAAVIDLDTAIDEYGIPFIPAKRIKGCMREVAEQILGLDADTLGGLFGERGSGIPGSLRLTDARISHYDDQLDEIKAAIQKRNIRANDITELFCSVRAETAIENDTTKDGALRFVRVVNRLSPIDKKPLRFYAEMEADDTYKDTVTTICKGLKNIGYKRNRGLGLVNCSLLPEESAFKLEPKSFRDEAQYRLNYLIYLNEDLMLPAADANRSMDYIPGTSAMGAMAEKYLQKFGEDGFDELFFSGSVVFGNLYVSDKDGCDYLPAPRFLAKIKAAKEEEKGIHNMIARKAEDDQKETKPQYKPLKKGYVSETGGHKEVETEIIYHNALNTEGSRENKGGLYTQYCVSSGQYFKGFITADGKSMKKLYPLFADGFISFGRSKTAQYSRCVIKDPKDVTVEEISKKTIPLKAGDTAAFLCESDVILVNDGRYTVDAQDFCAALNDSIGVRLLDEETLDPFTSLSTRVISGYNAKWNLKKTQYPVIKAGSTIVFQVNEHREAPERFTLDTRKNNNTGKIYGARQNEGYGQIRLIPDAKQYFSAKAETTDSQNPEGKTKSQQEEPKSELLRAVQRQKELDGILAAATADADRLTGKLNASQVGRLMLMCKESDCLADFERRINSIKTESYRDCATDSILKVIRSSGWENDWEKAEQYARSLLTVAKYLLKKKEGE